MIFVLSVFIAILSILSLIVILGLVAAFISYIYDKLAQISPRFKVVVNEIFNILGIIIIIAMILAAIIGASMFWYDIIN